MVIRAAVIGVGYLGQFHAEKYKKINNVKLVAVVDINKKRAREIAERFKTKAFYDYHDIIGKVDAASVVVPANYHYEITKDLLEAGIHVLVEKPIALNPEEADELIRIAERKSLILQVGHLERFNPAIVAISDKLKNPIFIRADRLGPYTSRGTDVDVILDLMIHDIDLILSIVNSNPVEIRAVGFPVLSDKIDIANARIEFSNGCIADITASRVSFKKIRKFRIFQRGSYISLDLGSRDISIFTKVDGEGMEAIEVKKIPVENMDPLEEEIRAFCHCIRTAVKPPVSGEEGKKALLLALSIKEAIEKSWVHKRLNQGR